MWIKKTSFMLLVGLTSNTISAETIKIYAASSLNNALEDIAQIYQAQKPEYRIVPVIAASSVLARQIEAGASSDLFFSADRDWMNYLVEKQKIQSNQVISVLSNQLVVIAPKHIQSNFKAETDFKFSQSFKGYLCTGHMKSVPVGKYAQQSLLHLNWLHSLKGRIVETDHVRSALAFVERGECERGIVYKTDALISKKVKIVGNFPSDSHRPIEYPLGLTIQGQKNRAAINFRNFIVHDAQAKQIFKKYGFQIKRETY